VHSVIFDLPNKLVAKTYHKLLVKMGSLQVGGVLYLRLLQSLANTLLFSIRFQRMPEPGWMEILNEVRIPMELAHIQVLGEIVTWVEHDLSKVDEQLLEAEHKPAMIRREPAMIRREEQNRRRQRRRILFRDRAHFQEGIMPNGEDDDDDEEELNLQIHRDLELEQRHVAHHQLQHEHQFGPFLNRQHGFEFMMRRREARMEQMLGLPPPRPLAEMLAEPLEDPILQPPMLLDMLGAFQQAPQPQEEEP